jgi:hypothetical protein
VYARLNLATVAPAVAVDAATTTTTATSTSAVVLMTSKLKERFPVTGGEE